MSFNYKSALSIVEVFKTKKMKRFFFIIMLMSFSSYINSQTISTEYIKKHAAHFTIENGEFQGKGKKMIQELVNSSQFITYGESHDSKQVSIITKALMGLLKKANFKHFAIEVGPTSAEKLTELSTPSSKTIENLYAFNSKYSVSQGDETAIPIPFFSGIEDAEFLQQASKNGMQLWGLDQEYYYSPFFLMDEMMRTVKNTPEFKRINGLKLLAQQAMFKDFMAEVQEKVDDAYPLIVKEEAVQNFFNAFSKGNTRAQKIIQDMKTSWDIYIRWRNDSHVDRISYMRNNFMEHYNTALKTEKTPKVFTKIGGLHAHKLFSNGAFDIGFLTEELAQKNGTISSTINTWIPFSKTEKGIVNNLEKYKRSYGRYAIMTKLAKENQWTIINLREIREDFLKGKISLPTNGDYHKIRRLIFGYDYLIMLPADEEITPNRKQ